MAAFLADGPLRSGRRWRMLPIRASGQPAFGKYLWDPARETFRAHGITVLTLDGAGVGEITNFLDVAPPDIGKASGTFSSAPAASTPTSASPAQAPARDGEGASGGERGPGTGDRGALTPRGRSDEGARTRFTPAI